MVCNQPGRRRVLVAATLLAEPCFRGVARYARQHGWHLVTDLMQTGAFPRGWKGDGIIAVIGYQSDLVRHIQGAGTPCVAIALGDDPMPFPSVRGDHAAVGRLAAEHLLERGYRSFAWAPFLNDQANRERCLGFESRLAESGRLYHTLPAAHRRIGGYWHDDWADYRRALLAKLPQLPRPTAIFAGNDCVAAEILDGCRDLALAVPGEIAVLGVGNDSVLCESTFVPLSSVGLDLEEMAFRAAAALDELIRGNSVPDLIVVPPGRVVTRLSTDTCAVSNSHVARALGFIAEHYPEPALSVTDVAAAVGMSRRQLERSFRTQTGCTVHEHIIKRRMQEASRLLRTHPRAKVAAIAELVGLDGTGTFFRTFRRFFGESPRVHRLGATSVHPPPPTGERTRVPA
ncbi:MAG TPA: DNA-binding transcriptional regulator [Lacunisphaera sp.]|nr:DNA-binding transcriptional regulator [Lacunisphaera sp.]